MADDKAIGELKLSITELSSEVKSSGDHIKDLAVSTKEQTKQIGTLSESVAILNTNFENRVNICEKSFTDIDDKFDRDYKRINDMEKKQAVENGIRKAEKEKKTETRASTGFFLKVVGGILGILIAINTVWGIAKKVNGEEPKPRVLMEQPHESDGR